MPDQERRRRRPRATTVDERADRPHIAPDDDDGHRAIVTSPIMQRELAWEWLQLGIALTGHNFHGESAALDTDEGRAKLRFAFEALWTARKTRG